MKVNATLLCTYCVVEFVLQWLFCWLQLYDVNTFCVTLTLRATPNRCTQRVQRWIGTTVYYNNDKSTASLWFPLWVLCSRYSSPWLTTTFKILLSNAYVTCFLRLKFCNMKLYVVCDCCAIEYLMQMMYSKNGWLGISCSGCYYWYIIMGHIAYRHQQHLWCGA